MRKNNVISLLVIINLLLIGLYLNSNINILLSNKKQIVKEMTQSELEEGLNSSISQLNAEHTEYMEYIQECKTTIATALTNEGVETSDQILLEEMAEKIPKILQARTRDATATAEDIIKDKTAYVNGELITGTRNDAETRVYLYKEGNECTDITGGWGSKATKNTDNMTISCSYGWNYASTKNKINISGYKYLCAEMSISGSVPIRAVVSLSSSNSSINYNNSIFLPGYSKNIVKANIETIDEDLYAVIGGGDGTATFYNIWLEK